MQFECSVLIVNMGLGGNEGEEENPGFVWGRIGSAEVPVCAGGVH